MTIAQSSSTVTNCTFSGNAARFGGGMDMSNGSPTLTNCTFSDNNATSHLGSGGNGGGMYIYDGSPTFTNCTFSENRADNDGDGMYISTGNPTVTNTIFWGENTAEGQVKKSGGTPTITYSVVDTNEFTSNTNTNDDPKLEPLADNGGPTFTCALLPGSSAIDKGNNDGAPDTDQRGVKRPQPKGGIVDIGAYEAEPAPKPEPEPEPKPEPEPEPEPKPEPTPTPTPVPLQPVDPPEGPGFVRATPLVVTLPPNPTEEQKKDALRKAFRDALVTNSLIEDLLELLEVDDSGQIYIGGDGIEQLRKLLDDLEIEEGTQMSPLAVIRASLDAQGTSAHSTEAGTAVFFFELPSCYTGLRCDQLQVVKAFSPERAALFERVYQLEDLRDRCAAVVEMKGKTLTRVLGPSDLITPSCRLALAIKDGGTFDLDGVENGLLVDPAFIVAGEIKSAPTPSKGGGGCTAQGFTPALLILLTPLALLKARK